MAVRHSYMIWIGLKNQDIALACNHCKCHLCWGFSLSCMNLLHIIHCWLNLLLYNLDILNRKTLQNDHTWLFLLAHMNHMVQVQRLCKYMFRMRSYNLALIHLGNYCKYHLSLLFGWPRRDQLHKINLSFEPSPIQDMEHNNDHLVKGFLCQYNWSMVVVQKHWGAQHLHSIIVKCWPHKS